MHQDTYESKLVEIDNSIRQEIIESISQVEDIQQKYNELKEKVRNLECRSRRDNLRVDGRREYEEESWDDTEELLKGILHEKLGVNDIQIERAHQAGPKQAGKDRAIIAKFSSYKGNQHALNEARC